MEPLLELHDPHAQVAGRRLVRRLGTGRRWSAFTTVLADDCASTPDAGEGSAACRPTLSTDAVLLRARSDAAERGLWRRAAILSRLDHPHILRLLDVAEDVGGSPCLLVERLSGGTLAELLRRRETIAPGEAVTILAPLVDAVRAAHLADIRHGAISASAVSLADDGRPVLAGWCEAAAVETDSQQRGRALQPDPAFATDWIALGRVIDGVLRATSSGETAVVSDWITDSVSLLADHELANRLQQRIHAVARPLPVLLDRAMDTAESPADMIRAGADLPAETIPTTRRETSPRRRRRSHGARSLVRRLRRRAGRQADRRADPSTSADATTSTSSPRSPSSRRPRLILGAVTAAAALVAGAMLLLPPVDEGVASEPVDAVESSLAATGTTGPAEGPPPAAGTEHTVEQPEEPVIDVDPVIATVGLLTAREACRGGRAAPACVLDYAELGSPFHEQELSGEPLGTIDLADPVLVDRQGDAAVLRSELRMRAVDGPGDERSQPVTLLVVRGETGWRLRDVFTAG